MQWTCADDGAGTEVNASCRVLTRNAARLHYTMRGCFDWIPDKARHRYRMFESACGRFSLPDRQLTPNRVRRVCSQYGIPAYKLRRIVRRQLAWDKYLRGLGLDPHYRFAPGRLKKTLTCRLDQTRAVRHSPDRQRILEEFSVWLNRIAKPAKPCGLGYTLPRPLRMIGQLELLRARGSRQKAGHG